MENVDHLALSTNRKRKSQGQNNWTLSFSMDQLNEDLLETVLSWLPASAFFRATSVSKRWKSVADSKSFKLACSRVPSRDPWFFMVGQNPDKSVVFDSTDRNWKTLNHPSFLPQHSNCMPVASSGGLVCFRNESGNFFMCNPVTGFSRELPPVDLASESCSLYAITMQCYSPYQYRLILVFGELPKLSFKIFNSDSNCWEQETLLNSDSVEYNSNENDPIYFLSKSGDVVATEMRKSPSKQYSAVTTLKNGDEIVFFLSSSGTIVSCNLTKKTLSEYPRLLPAFSEYSIDLVECRGEVFVIILSEFFESASVRVWKFEETIGSWSQVAVMPPAMSHELYGKDMDVNCGGAGEKIFMCLSSANFFSYVLCDVATNEWVELPKQFTSGESAEFMSAFSFEPRIEASL
ncbi:hypothetical protein ACFE04_002217 [Oxalis oulophora]